MCSSGQMTSNSIDRGLAAMPTQERSLRRDEPRLGGNQSYNQRQHREAMAKNTSPQGSDPRADAQPSQWDDADWDQHHDEAACHRARSEEHTSELQSRLHLVCRLLLEK